MHWYFAYGSNLLAKQMIARVGGIGPTDRPPRIASLAGYRVTFQSLAEHEPAYANIVSPGAGVQGVIYFLTEEQLKILDGYEKGYERHIVQVIDLRGEEISATTYVMCDSPELQFGPPSAEYLARIVTGAKEHGLTDEYVASIERAAG